MMTETIIPIITTKATMPNFASVIVSFAERKLISPSIVVIETAVYVKNGIFRNDVYENYNSSNSSNL